MPDISWTDRAVETFKRVLEDAEREHADAWKRRDRAAMARHDARRERAERVLQRLEIRATPTIPALYALCERLRAARDPGLLDAERKLVLTALRATNGHRERALATAGLSRRTFYRRMADLPPGSYPPAPARPSSPAWTLPADDVIDVALRAHGGNRSAACRALGLHPQALQHWAAKKFSR